jgi:short-subunit dehydrogenase
MVNTIGVINTITPLLPRLVARRHGQIALISSLAALEGHAEAPAYSASKAAVRIYGQGLRRLLSSSGVGVSVVCPGFIATAMSASLPFELPFLLSAERAAQIIADGLSRDHDEIMFPWQLKFAAKAATYLPRGMVAALIARARQGRGVANDRP